MKRHHLLEVSLQGALGGAFPASWLGNQLETGLGYNERDASSHGFTPEQLGQ